MVDDDGVVEEVVEFLGKCKRSLTPGGCIMIKENTQSDNGEALVDPGDHSILRSDAHFRRVFGDAGFSVEADALQRGFPASLYPVRMYKLVLK